MITVINVGFFPNTSGLHISHVQKSFSSASATFSSLFYGAGWRQLPTSSFHGSSFLGFTDLAHAMDSKWHFKPSHLSTCTIQLAAWNSSWETGLSFHIFTRTSRIVVNTWRLPTDTHGDRRATGCGWCPGSTWTELLRLTNRVDFAVHPE